MRGREGGSRKGGEREGGDHYYIITLLAGEQDYTCTMYVHMMLDAKMALTKDRARWRC